MKNLKYSDLQIENVVGCLVDCELKDIKTYNTIARSKLIQGGDLLTFYTEDWRWSRVIKSSLYFYETAVNFKYVCMPDYSVYYDEPVIDQLYKISVAYRICKRMENKGIKILRNLFMTSPSIFDVNIYGDYSGDFCVQLQTKTEIDKLKEDVALCNSIINRKFVYAPENEYNRLVSMGLTNTVRIPTYIDNLRTKLNVKK